MTPASQCGIDRVLAVLDGDVEPVNPEFKTTKVLRILAAVPPGRMLPAAIVGRQAGLSGRDAQRILSRLHRAGSVSRAKLTGPTELSHFRYFMDALQHSRFRIQTEGAGLPDALGAADIADLAEKLHFLERLRTREALGRHPIMVRILEDYAGASRIALARAARLAEGEI